MLNEKIVLTTLKSVKRDSIFTLIFLKKDMTFRRMTCRRDVRKHLKGGESTINNNLKLVSVYDVQAKGYRCFDITRVVLIRAEGFEIRDRNFDISKYRIYNHAGEEIQLRTQEN